jgi:hypothetical protein
VDFEVVVLDDQSTDATPHLVREMAARDPRVRLEAAPALPAGWCGKQHACHVLAGRARNPVLVFMDADVTLAPDALRRMVGFLRTRNVALASGVPRQITGTFFERLLIPLIHFVLLGFLPVWRMRRCTKPAYAAGCGQLFICEAAAYRQAGGHAAIRRTLHDGLKLPRLFRQAGLCTDLFDATPLATCRMYHGAGEVFRGLAKNATEGLAAPLMIGPMTTLLLLGQVMPWVLLALAPWTTSSVTSLAAWAAVCSWVPRLLAVWRYQQSLLGALLHPLGILLLLTIQWQAFLMQRAGKPQHWKGRSYGAPSLNADLHGALVSDR